jgi:hypothetical protein
MHIYFWLWKLINSIFFIQIFITRVVSQGSHILHMIISKQDIHICYLFHIYLSITLSSVLKPKSSLSTRNKCAYLLEASETIITIWGQEIAIFRMCLCFLWMAPRKNEIVEGSYYTLSLCCFFICEKKNQVTNNN